MSYGAKLRKIRVDEEISLNEVAQELKININVLKKLEDSKSQELPNKASTRGFIRSYCQYLGIDSDEIVEEYLSSLEEQPLPKKTDVLKGEEESPTFFISDFLLKSILPFALLLLISFVGVYAFKTLRTAESDNQKTAQQIESTENLEQAKLDQVAAVEKAEPQAEIEVISTEVKKADLGLELKDSKVAQAKEDPQQNLGRLQTFQDPAAKISQIEGALKVAETSIAAPQASTVKKQKLVVEPLAVSYLHLKLKDDKGYVKVKLRPDQIRTFVFESGEFKFFDAGAVNLFYNGKDKGSPGSFGQAKTLFLPSDDF